ncbi:MAG TPA: hypothetical protein VFX20_18070 [Steroidobacteraceae bacterium]|nr:hypothetical protein [Steroidobacteraceae bacterium]
MPSTQTDRLFGINSAVAIKAPVLAVALGNIALTGLQTIGGYATQEGDRVLVMGQTDATANGIYNASQSAWQRAGDFDGAYDVVQGTVVTVVSAGQPPLYYVLTTVNPQIGSSALNFVALAVNGTPNYAETTAEQSGATPPTDFSVAPVPINVARYGIVPNLANAADTNTAALQALLDPTKTGPTGRLIFPNITGADTYYFSGMIQVRDGIHMDLNHCTLSFSKVYASADDTMGFFTFIRDVTVENGSIAIDYDGTGGTNPGAAFRIGSRSSYPFGSFAAGIFDQDDLAANSLPLMGNIALRNLYISSNNAGVVAMILMTGGLRNVSLENIHFDGQGVVDAGAYYEFGWSSKNSSATTSDWTSSHACNLRFTNLHAQHLQSVGTVDSGVVALVGAHHAIIENCIADHCINGITCRIGEALFFRPWTPTDLEGAKRGISVRNCTVTNSTNIGFELLGAEAASGGYLSGAGLTDSQQVDLMEYEVSGCNVQATARGAFLSGNFTMRNCRFDGTANSGQVLVTDDVTQFSIDRCDFVNSIGGNGLVLGGSSIGVWATARKKMGRVSNCLIAGNSGGSGIIVENARHLEIADNRIGFNALYDPAGEASQTSGINVVAGSGGGGVIARGNFVTTNSGTAYAQSGTVTDNCDIQHPKNEATSSGIWDLNGVAIASATQIADKTSVVNTVGKRLGRMAVDSSNSRLMIAVGGTATSNWERADGAVSVTPA